MLEEYRPCMHDQFHVYSFVLQLQLRSNVWLHTVALSHHPKLLSVCNVKVAAYSKDYNEHGIDYGMHAIVFRSEQ